MKRLLSRVHGSIAGIFESKTEISIDKADLEDLNEAGAEIVVKYDRKGWLSRYWAEALYVLTLVMVVLKTTWRYVEAKEERKQQPTETAPKGDVPKIDLPKSPGAR